MPSQSFSLLAVCLALVPIQALPFSASYPHLQARYVPSEVYVAGASISVKALIFISILSFILLLLICFSIWICYRRIRSKARTRRLHTRRSAEVSNFSLRKYPQLQDSDVYARLKRKYGRKEGEEDIELPVYSKVEVKAPERAYMGSEGSSGVARDLKYFHTEELHVPERAHKWSKHRSGVARDLKYMY